MKRLLLPTLILLVTGLKAQFTTTNMITGLPYPVVVEIAPDGRFLISCKGGAGSGAPANAQVRVYNPDGSFQANLWDFTDSVETYFERGVLGVACDPDFMTNHYVYVFYNHDAPAMLRVVRFTESGGVGSSPTIIFEVNDPFTAGNHTGGNIHFKPSDPNHLFITIGDRATSSNAPDLTKWAGKMLRIHKNGTIPTDNPFYDDGNPATGNDDRIWTYSHRNMFDFCFNTNTDTLYGSENGQNTEDEVNIVTKGLEYGWPDCEGVLPYLGSCAGHTAPLEVFPGPPAVTGIMFYTGTTFPAYTNHLIMTDYNDGNVWDLTLGNAPSYNTFVSRAQITALSSFNSLIDITQGLEGCWYVIDGGYTTNGKLVRICPTGFSIDEQANGKLFTVYPNPANDRITVEGFNLRNVELFDLNGKKVLQSTQKTIDISSLSKGIYQLRVNGIAVDKVVKL